MIAGAIIVVFVELFAINIRQRVIIERHKLACSLHEAREFKLKMILNSLIYPMGAAVTMRQRHDHPLSTDWELYFCGQTNNTIEREE
mmetsp:Transcript_13352/g.27089  ORF Transcript_13352/g.27089 Transcript_13352/m.27089 type:complete len:87 (-) Transcript_13352:1776-2036(-)